MKIIVLGAGTFGTAIANELSFNKENNVVLFSRHQLKVDEINTLHTNKNCFPNKHLNESLRASSNRNDLKKANIILLALPSHVMISYLLELRPYFNQNILFLNLSKGIFSNGVIIVDGIKNAIKTDQVVSLKGPSFAVEIMERSETLLTLGYEQDQQRKKISKIFNNTSLYLDYTHDILGVEILSVVKNIYALFIGVVDAKYNSSNTRFMVLTKTFSEIRLIARSLGCKEDTLFLACGLGDFCLTSLNDLSRNRTLGLLIGKGFFNSDYNVKKVITEGFSAIDLVYSMLDDKIKLELPIFNTLYKYIKTNKSIMKIDFDDLIKIK